MGVLEIIGILTCILGAVCILFLIGYIIASLWDAYDNIQDTHHRVRALEWQIKDIHKMLADEEVDDTDERDGRGL
jgi:uncharacterized protein YoxC